MNNIFKKQYIKILYLLILFLITYFIFYKFYTSRNIIAGDEFINIAERSYQSNLINSILDYSLRPLYRVINIFWVYIFGYKLESLLIGSRITFGIMCLVYSIFVWRVSKSFLVLTFSLFLLLGSPELFRIGLGALPQIYSGFFLMMYGIFFYYKIETITKHTNEFFIYNLLSYFCVFLALLSHPTMLAALIYGLFLDILFMLLLILSKESKIVLIKYLKNFFLSLFFLFILIIFTNYIYLLFQDSLPSMDTTMVLSAERTTLKNWTFINLWYSTLFNVNVFPSSFTKPFFFYFKYLFESYKLFYLLWIFSIIILIYSIISKKINFDKISNFSKLIFTAISVAHLLFLSYQSVKFYYVLASLAPIASLSIAVVLKDTLYENKFKITFILIILALLTIYSNYLRMNKETTPFSEEYKYLFSNKIKNFFTFDSSEYQIQTLTTGGHRGIRFCGLVSKANNLETYNIKNDTQSLPEGAILCIGTNQRNGKTNIYIEHNKLCQILINGGSEILFFKKCE
jgi:hypothetical protein